MLEIVSVAKSFGPTRALDGVSLTVRAGEVAALLGPSGCGKSTLLAIVAGLETPDHGEVKWGGASLAQVPPHERRFGLMFQDYALFPHKNVRDNVAFGLRMQHRRPDEIARAVAETLERVDLQGFAERDVNTLSGGEQQRVALARALAPSPRLLMLDEPLGALDRNLREEILAGLRALLSGQTVIYVTHDQQEAFAVAERVAVMNAGRIVQIGAPEAVYARPASAFVARFLGLTNLIDAVRTGAHTVATPLGSFALDPSTNVPPGPSQLLIRPDAARLTGEANRLSVLVTDREFRGSRVRLTVEAESAVRLDFEFAAGSLPSAGERCLLFLDPTRLTLLPANAASRA